MLASGLNLKPGQSRRFGLRLAPSFAVLALLGLAACGDLDDRPITGPDQAAQQAPVPNADPQPRRATAWSSASLSELTRAVERADGRVFIGLKDSALTAGVDSRGRALLQSEARARAAERVRAITSAVEHEFQLTPAFVARVSAEQLARLRESPYVDYVEPVVHGELAAQTVPWGITKVQAPTTWAQSTGQGVKVGVLDSGIDYSHSDLSWSISYRCNLAGDTIPAYDQLGHGTHVAGTIAADNNSLDVVGVSPDVVLYSANVVVNGNSPNVDAAEVACALEWARLNGLQVVNMSFSFGGGPVQAVTDQINGGFYQDDIVFVASAGNDSIPSVGYPASLSTVLAVTALNQSDQKPAWANWGSGIDLAAPGEAILSTALVPGSTGACGSVSSSTSLCSGTSMATAHVSGVAALVRERYPGWTNSQVIARLKSTAYDLGAGGYDTVYGYGRVQAYEAVNMSVQMAGPHSASPGSSESWTVSVNGGQLPLSYQWYVNGSPQGTGTQLSLTVPSSDFSISVEVTDGAGGTGGDSRMILVCGHGSGCD